MSSFRHTERRLDRIETLLHIIIEQGFHNMAVLDGLQADVAAEDTVIGSALTLIQGFSVQLAAAGVDPAALAALRADIQAKTQSLAAAVAANTPAATPPATPAA